MNIGRRRLAVPRPPRRAARALTALTAAGALLALGACSATGGGDGRDGDGRLKVTASFYPLEFLARQIGGDHVAVTDLTSPGTEPHDLELSPRQTAALGESGAVLYLHGLQPAVDEAVRQSGVAHVADAAAFSHLEQHGSEVDGSHHTTGDNGTGDADEDGAGADPHIWLDPVRFAQVAKGVGRTLAAADPGHRATYEKNTDTLVNRLDALDRRYREGLEHRTSDTFITTHAAFGYLAERYGLTEEAVSGVDPESGDVSGARIRELQELAHRHHVHTVFFETLASPTTAKTLARDVGAGTDVLDPLEGITKASRGRDYFQVMDANLTALRKALGAS
ncbi:metal ABC transporter solute-binding protein, Zn/Mn family [Streptomyces sp. NPDC059740]|uniref:metal ABC transporter solute-binding protein, Zn/Mn family n=1 Tax=Streptomyces sp. NPDC059740 TaxID=3346926 RepID=UPI00365C645C